MRRAAIALAALVGATALAGCGGSGWTALPLDSQQKCFQIQSWQGGWTTQHAALGTFCKAAVR